LSFREISASVFLYAQGTELFSLTLFDLWRGGLFGPVSALGMLMMCGFSVIVALGREFLSPLAGAGWEDGRLRMAGMIMGLFIGYGHGPRGWDDPRLRESYDWRRPELYQDLALVCERGFFDLMVFADVLGIPEAFRGTQATSIRYGLEGICH